MEYVLPLEEIAEHYDKEKLEKVEHELNEDDYEFYDKHGWKHYCPENHFEYLLPSFGEEFTVSETYPIVEVMGRRYKVDVRDDRSSQPWDAAGKTLVLTEVTEPQSQKMKASRFSFYRFFGQPQFVQGEVYPAHDGKPCYHFLTVENGWGDAGNWNIFLALDDNGLPKAAYFEASCH
jgi:hypothetical protein